MFANADHLHTVLTTRLASPSTARIAATANSGYYLNINTGLHTHPQTTNVLLACLLVFWFRLALSWPVVMPLLYHDQQRTTD